MSETIALASCYATLVHELTHRTGAKHRLDREFGKRFGDQAYAAEELVAEIGAAFLCAELRITQETRPDHAQYLAQWLTLLKGDQRALFAASEGVRSRDVSEALQRRRAQRRLNALMYSSRGCRSASMRWCRRSRSGPLCRRLRSARSRKRICASRPKQ
jgi:antirestriction protein ArdC